MNSKFNLNYVSMGGDVGRSANSFRKRVPSLWHAHTHTPDFRHQTETNRIQTAQTHTKKYQPDVCNVYGNSTYILIYVFDCVIRRARTRYCVGVCVRATQTGGIPRISIATVHTATHSSLSPHKVSPKILYSIPKSLLYCTPSSTRVR